MRNLAQRHWKVLFLFCLVGMDLLILDLSPWMGLMLRFRARFPMASAFSGGAPLLWVVNGSLMVGLIGFGTYRNAARLSLWAQVVRFQKAVLPVFLGTVLFLFLIQSEVTQVRGVLFHSFVISYVLMLLGRFILYRWNVWLCAGMLDGEGTWVVRTGSSTVAYQGMGQEASEGGMVAHRRFYETVKRGLDVVGAMIALVLFSPLFLICGRSLS